jgi:SulP family sulfate permease
MMGFVNGLAIVIFMAQVRMFSHKEMSVAADGVKQYLNIPMEGMELYTMLGLVGLTMAIIWFLPKITTKIPAALTAILVTTAVVVFGGLDVSTVGSYIIEGGGEGLKGEFPTPNTDLWKNLPINPTEAAKNAYGKINFKVSKLIGRFFQRSVFGVGNSPFSPSPPPSII